jgi:hypothetical protein
MGGNRMGMLGFGLDTVIIVLLLVGWIVVMRFILPKLGIST